MNKPTGGDKNYFESKATDFRFPNKESGKYLKDDFDTPNTVGDEITKLVSSFCLEGKITEQHAKEIEEVVEDYKSEALEEYKQFVLNVLDGVDIADQHMGNKGGGTKAIRLALQSRNT